MNEVHRVQEAWKRIEQWLSVNFPEALQQLRPPATDREIANVEAEIKLQFPEVVKASFKIHDGEDSQYGVLADSFWLLPLNHVLERWRWNKFDDEEIPELWKVSVEDKVISIKGEVKPLACSTKWIPLATMDGKVNRFLDFNPPDGGIAGQVIEVDLECGLYKVIASSFLDFLEQYAAELEAGFYIVDDERIETPEEAIEDPTKWEMPEYLKSVEYEYYDPKMPSDNPIIANLKPNEEVTIVGSICGDCVFGGDENLFDLKTEKGDRYRCLAKQEITKGFNTIGVNRYVRIKAVQKTEQIDSYFARTLNTQKPELVALECKMLR